MSSILILFPRLRSFSSSRSTAALVRTRSVLRSGPHDQAGVQFRRRDDRLLHLVVHRRFFRRDEAGAHIHAVGAHREGSDQAARIRHAAGRDKGNRQFVGRTRQQDHIGDIVFARMAAALEPVHRYRVAADRLGFERMADRGAFVDDPDAFFLQPRQMLLRVTAGCFHHRDPAVDDCIDIFRIGSRLERGQESEVHTERLVGQLMALGDFFRQVFRRLLGQPGDDAQTAGVRHRRRQFREADIVHAALDDRMLDTEHFGDTGFHRAVLSGGVGRSIAARSSEAGRGDEGQS